MKVTTMQDWVIPSQLPWSMAHRHPYVAFAHYSEIKVSATLVSVPMIPGYPFGGAVLQAHRGSYLQRLVWTWALYKMLHDEDRRDSRAARALAVVNYIARRDTHFGWGS